jgi:hypothetical protein
LPNAFFLPPNMLRKFSAPDAFFSALHCLAAFFSWVGVGSSAAAPAGKARAAASAPPTISFFIPLPP